MSFKAVVSGTALQPTDAPEMMQTVIKDLNNRTVAELLEAIRSNLLTEAWKVKGGWKNWFYAVVKGTVTIIGKVLKNSKLFETASDGSDKNFEVRLLDYFKSQGYELNEAAEMAAYISNHLNA